ARRRTIRRGIPPVSRSRLPADSPAGGIARTTRAEVCAGRCLGCRRHVEPLLYFQDSGLDSAEALAPGDVRLPRFLQFQMRRLAVAVERLQNLGLGVAPRLPEFVELVLHFAPKLLNSTLEIAFGRWCVWIVHTAHYDTGKARRYARSHLVSLAMIRSNRM